MTSRCGSRLRITTAPTARMHMQRCRLGCKRFWEVSRCCRETWPLIRRSLVSCQLRSRRRSLCSPCLLERLPLHRQWH